MPVIGCHACCVVLLVTLLVEAGGLVCYNGTVSSMRFGSDPLATGDPCFWDPALARLRCAMAIVCGENAMCFVRSWSARGRHAWLVQRGCYHHSGDDPLPRSVLIPTRAMACKKERLRDAEYRVCLCQADWCNAAVPNLNDALQLVKIYICIIVYIFSTNLYMMQ